MEQNPSWRVIQHSITRDHVMREDARTRAEATFAKKERQRTEGEAAMGDYRAQQKALLANTVRLRALRMRREAAGAQEAAEIAAHDAAVTAAKPVRRRRAGARSAQAEKHAP
jgi:hypothetical protein